MLAGIATKAQYEQTMEAVTRHPGRVLFNMGRSASIFGHRGVSSYDVKFPMIKPLNSVTI